MKYSLYIRNDKGLITGGNNVYLDQLKSGTKFQRPCPQCFHLLHFNQQPKVSHSIPTGLLAEAVPHTHRYLVHRANYLISDD